MKKKIWFLLSFTLLISPLSIVVSCRSSYVDFVGNNEVAIYKLLDNAKLNSWNKDTDTYNITVGDNNYNQLSLKSFVINNLYRNKATQQWAFLDNYILMDSYFKTSVKYDLKTLTQQYYTDQWRGEINQKWINFNNDFYLISISKTFILNSGDKVKISMVGVIVKADEYSAYAVLNPNYASQSIYNINFVFNNPVNKSEWEKKMWLQLKNQISWFSLNYDLIYNELIISIQSINENTHKLNIAVGLNNHQLDIPYTTN